MTTIQKFYSKKMPYPVHSKAAEEYFTDKSLRHFDNLFGSVDFVNDTPLRVAILYKYLKDNSANLWHIGFTSSMGLWFPFKAFTFDCCEKINAPSISNPYGLKYHCTTNKHLLNLLSKVYKVDKEKIKENLAPAKMTLAMDNDLFTIINSNFARM